MASNLYDRGLYYIMNTRTLTVLNVLNNGPAGTQVVGASANFPGQAANSVWRAERAGDDTWKFECIKTQTVACFGSASPLTQLTAENPLDSRNQQWVLDGPHNHSFAPTCFRLRNYETGLYIDLQDGNGANGAPVVSQKGVGPNQDWMFIDSNGSIS